MATLKGACGFQGGVPDGALGREFVCTQCGRRLVAVEDRPISEVQHAVPESLRLWTSSYGQREQEKEVKITFSGGIGPVGPGFEEIREARRNTWKGGFLLVVFGIPSLMLFNLSICLAVISAVPALYGVVLLLLGWYGEYINEHGIPKK